MTTPNPQAASRADITNSSQSTLTQLRCGLRLSNQDSHGWASNGQRDTFLGAAQWSLPEAALFGSLFFFGEGVGSILRLYGGHHGAKITPDGTYG